MPAKVMLEVMSGPIQGKVFSFESHDTFLFGRHGTCHARLPNDPLVSRHHFILEANPPDIRLRDLGSLNGTDVNGVKCGGRGPNESPADTAGRQHPVIDLKNGDRITVGKTTIEVRVLLSPRCCQCSAEISETDRKLAEWTPGSFMCSECQMRSLVTLMPHEVPPTVDQVPRCQQCGREVPTEVRNGRRGSYVCEACRGDLVSQTGALRRLMQEAAENFRGQLGFDIAGYDIGAELGKGGMGIVFHAMRKSDQQQVAVKVMLARVAVDESVRQMFQREIEITRKLLHPHIVSLNGNGSAGSAFYFVMEYCNGGSLHQLMQRHQGKLSLGTATPLMLQCLAGLEYAHQQKVVHRDLKPQNILLDERHGHWSAKISDFGLAKDFERAGLSGMTATGGMAGTYRFMPREQLTEFKYIRPVSDVWSLGATFYNALTGRYPLEFAPQRDPMEVILHDEPIPLRQREPSIPVPVAEVIDRALATDAAQRFQTAAEMRVCLESASGAR